METKPEVKPEAVVQQQAAAQTTTQAASQAAGQAGATRSRPAGKTAVLFLMTGTSKEDMESLRFFVRNALTDSSATFILAVPNPVSCHPVHAIQ